MRLFLRGRQCRFCNGFSGGFPSGLGLQKFLVQNEVNCAVHVVDGVGNVVNARDGALGGRDSHKLWPLLLHVVNNLLPLLLCSLNKLLPLLLWGVNKLLTLFLCSLESTVNRDVEALRMSDKGILVECTKLLSSKDSKFDTRMRETMAKKTTKISL